MKVPKGYSEKEVIDLINTIVNHLANPFKFGYYDQKDMKQQWWVYALEALPKYRASKSQLSTFLTTHIRNRFINLKRDKFERHLPPCKNCPFYKAEEDLCGAYEAKNNCDRWVIWETRNTAKKSLVDNSTELDDSNEPSTNSLHLLEELHQSDIIQYIDKNLPQEYRKDYRKLLDGLKISKTKQEKLISIIQELLRGRKNG